MQSVVRSGGDGVQVEFSAWTPTINRVLETFFLPITNPESKRLHCVTRLQEGLELIELTREPVDLLVLVSCRLHMGHEIVPEVDEHLTLIVRGMHNRLTSEQYAELIKRLPTCLRDRLPL